MNTNMTGFKWFQKCLRPCALDEGIATALEGLTIRYSTPGGHGISQYLETGCPNRGFIDFCVSLVWYKVHTTNKLNPIYLQILLF